MPLQINKLAERYLILNANKSNLSMRRRSSIGASAFKVDDDEFEAALLPEPRHSMDRQHSRLSDVSFTMDRTSFADPDRLTVLMGESEDLKQELTLHIIESFPWNTQSTPHVF